ncbi:MAG TPA: aspartate--tRNA(Asn) ligase [Thermoplasmatales archaeon]|nr:aspartate--tRNA(Asn) ligase [Thermoplasmatales archaeon]
MLRTHYVADVGEKEQGTEVTLAGWIEDIRNLGGIAFLLLRDKTGRGQLTCIKKEAPDIFESLTGLTRESVVAVTGPCQKNERVRNGWEVLPRRVTVLSTADAPLPMGVADKVNVDFDTRLDNRFMDLRRDEVQAVFRIRDTFIAAAASFLAGQGFLQVHTPKITRASPEGGTEVFRIDYFGRDAYLVQSPQLYKQMLMATGLDRVYEVAWYFRAESHDTTRHLNESTALDVEMAFIDSEEDVMAVAEGVVHASLEAMAAERAEELALLNVELEVPRLPFPRITYDRAVEMVAEEKDFTWGQDLGTEEEKMVGRKMEAPFYFITKYPLEAKPFYAMPDDDGRMARGFDLACRGTEIASGAQRIHDPALLEKRLRQLDMNVDNFADYLRSFRYGMPPHGGFGSGIERFLMEALHLGNIRECILFPRDQKRISP